MAVSPSSTPLRKPAVAPALIGVPTEPPTSPAAIVAVVPPPEPSSCIPVAEFQTILQGVVASVATIAAGLEALKHPPAAVSILTPPGIQPVPNPAPTAQPTAPNPWTAITHAAETLEFAMSISWPHDEHLRLLELTKGFLGHDLANLASQSVKAGLASPLTAAHHTTTDGFRRLKDIEVKLRAAQQIRIDNGEIGTSSTLAATPKFPLVSAITRSPSREWKNSQLPEYLISSISQGLSAVVHSNPNFAIPCLLQVLHILKVVEFDQALGQASWPFLVPIFDQLAKDSLHRPTIWTTPLLAQTQEARHAYNVSLKLPALKEPRAASPPQAASWPRPLDRDRATSPSLTDRHTRPASSGPRPICANWNADRACASSNCSFTHVCSACKGPHRHAQCRDVRTTRADAHTTRAGPAHHRR